MSSKYLNQNNSNETRTYFITNKKQSKKKKPFNYPKLKSYSEETEIESISSKKWKEMREEETNSDFLKTNEKFDMVYKDEYQGLIYNPSYLNITFDDAYYYLENEPKEDYNNFKTKWKTEKCHYWEMYGECKFGNNCAFAHGDSELKQRKMTFNYKTKPCKQFFEIGYCSYGIRCQFSHKKDDLKNQKDETKNKNDKVSYLKIIEELLSGDNTISHELVKRPRLMTFENITHSTLEESKNSKLKLYEDIINLKNDKIKNNKNISFKLSDDTNSNSNISSEY